jgi:hypothetical protein
MGAASTKLPGSLFETRRPWIAAERQSSMPQVKNFDKI